MYSYRLDDVGTERRVAIYARVSTEHEAQLSALGNQLDWYKTILAQHPEWTLVREPYVDEGLTGTSAKKRPNFLRMIEDAKQGKFDLLLTREVSRFARNTVDTLQYTRDLKAHGVEVFFLNDNIRTFDGDGELRLTIMATLAQDESRKTSIRVKAGQQTSMDNGVYYGNGNILGYRREGRTYVIDPEQARTVRRIYDLYLDGAGLRKIQFALETEGHLTATGKSNWHQANICKVLKNPFYCGKLVYHKQWTPNYLEQKKINNIGDIPLTQVDGTHEPIVTVEEFMQVQTIMGSHRRKESDSPNARVFGKKPPSDVWVKLLECGCGHTFNRKVWHSTKDSIQYGYQCYAQLRSGSVKTRQNRGLSIEGICAVPMVAGWKLQMMADHIFRDYLQNKEKVLDLAQQMLEEHISDDAHPEADNSQQIADIQGELNRLNKRLDSLIEMRADGDITREQFRSRKSDLEEKQARLTAELRSLMPMQEEVDEEPDYAHKITILRYALEQYMTVGEGQSVPEDIIDAFVEKIIVTENEFKWYLRFSGVQEPVSCTITGGKRRGDTPPAFAYSTTGCYPQSSEVIPVGIEPTNG